MNYSNQSEKASFLQRELAQYGDFFEPTLVRLAFLEEIADSLPAYSYPAVQGDVFRWGRHIRACMNSPAASSPNSCANPTNLQ